MDKTRITVVSCAALLALPGTASAGPMSVASAQIISPPMQIEQAHYYYRHHYRHYGWHRGWHYGWYHHRHYGWYHRRYKNRLEDSSSSTMSSHYCPVKYRTNSTGYMATHRRCRRQRLERRGKAGFSRKSGRIKSVGK